MQTGDSREDRLVKVVQKLEAKVKSIWDEKNALEQRLELATLDKELAEERYLAEKALSRSEAAAKSALEARVAELEELRALSVELEESYIEQKEELATELGLLKKELAAASEKAKNDARAAELRIQELLASQTSAQSVESLRQKLETTKLQLAACELDLAAHRDGLTNAIRPLFSQKLPEFLNLLPFIDYYALAEALNDAFSKFREGDLSPRRFARAIEEQIDHAENDKHRPMPTWAAFFALLKSVDGISSHVQSAIERLLTQESLTPKIRQLLETLLTDIDGATIQKLENEVRAEITQRATADAESKRQESLTTHANLQSEELEALSLRVRFLESKLSQAQNLAAEIDNLKKWQTEARRRESHLEDLLAESEQNVKAKIHEIEKLKRAELPTTLDAAVVQQKLKGMKTALQWFSRTQHVKLNLEPLHAAAPRRISALTGNPRVSAMRRAIQELSLDVLSLHDETSPKAAVIGRKALDQYEKLVALGCIKL